MNAGRFVGASVAVFVVRTLMNFLFYGYAMRGRYEEMSAAHPGMFREVIPAYLVLDLISASSSSICSRKPAPRSAAESRAAWRSAS